MRRTGPFSEQETDRFLEETRVPVRVACHSPSGHPLLASLWFVPLEGKLWCATQQSARIVELLQRDPRCAFEVSLETPPYRGVRGAALASLHAGRGEEILRQALDRYMGGTETDFARKLLAKVESETAIALEPSSIVSWDFRDRMGDAA